MLYLREKEITADINEANMNFSDGEWKETDTLESYGYVGVSHLSPSHLARYIAVQRKGLINLKEVEVYQRSSE